ncbi:MAG: 3-hydroxyacyl-CoA dehydrogenase family protein [Polyangiaceae bacterium]|nr:3-hydroxyacyl-CoA dehydrogenase family protein [Myxococcales bacterium]MCB9587037.1 3-hydroxyacyl-CoA dehydrogenase family protein [Polyangiaceae bacterium]MCB9610111.1 3-hydroxyacyl-CoA dehydrogenase family protein [Polyangiaceae bacterium]
MSDVREVWSVAVLGAGTMGMGIAQLCATRGITTRLFDVQHAQLERADSGIKKQLARAVEKGRMSEGDSKEVLGRITRTENLEEAVADAELVIEAIPEQMDLKVEIFRSVISSTGENTLLGSNTSSLSLTELGKRLGEAERVVGLHFFNPPPVMPLLEIVRGLSTSEASVERALAFARQLEKEPIVVNDFPGFASSRLGVALGAEAIRMLESGVASAVDIDRAMELGYRHPMGPLKLTDLVGLDVRLAILEHLHRELGEQFRPPALLRQMVRAGRTGRKAGIGFYRWTDEGPVPA